LGFPGAGPGGLKAPMGTGRAETQLGWVLLVPRRGSGEHQTATADQGNRTTPPDGRPGRRTHLAGFDRGLHRERSLLSNAQGALQNKKQLGGF